ncbi:hypothetical protein ScPMuIL_001853 [Solemya velum]
MDSSQKSDMDCRLSGEGFEYVFSLPDGRMKTSPLKNSEKLRTESMRRAPVSLSRTIRNPHTMMPDQPDHQEQGLLQIETTPVAHKSSVPTAPASQCRTGQHESHTPTCFMGTAVSLQCTLQNDFTVQRNQTNESTCCVRSTSHVPTCNMPYCLPSCVPVANRAKYSGSVFPQERIMHCVPVNHLSLSHTIPSIASPEPVTTGCILQRNNFVVPAIRCQPPKEKVILFAPTLCQTLAGLAMHYQLVQGHLL